MPVCDERLPVELDPFRMAELGRQYKGCLEFKHMPRLLAALASKQGQLETELVFGIDEQGIAVLKGRIRTELGLQCQRCLEAMRFPVEINFKLALLRHDSEIEQLPEIYEPLLVTSVPIRLAEVLEDEVLLALPAIAKHESEDCGSFKTSNDEPQEETTAIKENPFAVLAELKKDQ